MMDLREATSSLDHYASRLDVHLKTYEMTVAMAEVEKKTPDIDPRPAGLDDTAVAELERVFRDAQILSILISRAIAKEADRLLDFPGELAELLEAQKRIDPVFQRTLKLLKDREQKQAEKNAPPKLTQFQKALLEYGEKRREEERMERATRERI
jgi:hypothetical protein